MLCHTTKSLAHFMLLASMIVGIAMADSSKDKQECTEQLVGLATCLPYIQGESKAPPPDCCTGLNQVLKENKKCLCLVIKDRNDPDFGGLMINVTSALSLPTACNSPANISKCPELLHMDPKSQEAQVFYQLTKGPRKSGPSPAPSTSVGGNAARSQTTNATQKSDAFCKEKSLFGFQNLAAGILVWLLFGLDARNFVIWTPM